MSGTQSKKSANFCRLRYKVRRHAIACAVSRLQAGQPRESAATGIVRIRVPHNDPSCLEAHRVAREPRPSPRFAKLRIRLVSFGARAIDSITCWNRCSRWQSTFGTDPRRERTDTLFGRDAHAEIGALPDPFDGLFAERGDALSRIHAGMGCPLRVEEHVLGALGLDVLSPTAFDEVDDKTVAVLASSQARRSIRDPHRRSRTSRSEEPAGRTRAHPAIARARCGEIIGTSEGMVRTRARSDGGMLIAIPQCMAAVLALVLLPIIASVGFMRKVVLTALGDHELRRNELHAADHHLMDLRSNLPGGARRHRDRANENSDDEAPAQA
jgi:hypothetical protein